MKTACITGITGQTGSYLAELLLKKGYDVHGLVRRGSTFTTERIDHIFDNPYLKLHYGDLSDYSSISSFVSDIKPFAFFNLAAQSHVRVSFDIPEYTMDVNATGVMRVLEAIRRNSPKTRVLQASTSELFGSTPPPQNEQTVMHPRSPYAAAKMAGYWATINYREGYDLFACNSISFNHESPRRGETFLTRKVTRGATRIKVGLQEKLRLGNLDSKRDWSHAKDVARAMIMMIEADSPKDYVIGTGEMHSVKKFVEVVFEQLDLKPWQHVMFDPKYTRPSEVDALCADPSLIKKDLGWEPEYSFEQLVEEMIKYDLETAEREKFMKDNYAG